LTNPNGHIFTVLRVTTGTTPLLISLNYPNYTQTAHNRDFSHTTIAFHTKLLVFYDIQSNIYTRSVTSRSCDARQCQSTDAERCAYFWALRQTRGKIVTNDSSGMAAPQLFGLSAQIGCFIYGFI